ncbi:MAG: PhzF family phenazine biosynthesis protein [Sciscionella sp.]
MDLFVVDAFATQAFTGNPAGVVLLTEPREAAWMQAIAAELSVSETAFVAIAGAERAGDPLPLRWFTPTTEVDLCGHATLAATHVLGGEQRYDTRSGVLGASAQEGGWVELDFPADPPAALEPPATLLAALPGVTVRAVAQGISDLLVELDSAAEVRELRPDLAGIAALPVRGVIVTAVGDGDADFVSRCFYPAQGVDEDPVTGSAHCTLACWWSDKLERAELLGEQVSRRGGRVRVSRREHRVRLAGQAVTVLTGRLTV